MTDRPAVTCRCSGRGWYPTEDSEVYCDCAAGTRLRVEDQAHVEAVLRERLGRAEGEP